MSKRSRARQDTNSRLQRSTKMNDSQSKSRTFVSHLVPRKTQNETSAFRMEYARYAARFFKKPKISSKFKKCLHNICISTITNTRRWRAARAKKKWLALIIRRFVESRQHRRTNKAAHLRLTYVKPWQSINENATIKEENHSSACTQNRINNREYTIRLMPFGIYISCVSFSFVSVSHFCICLIFLRVRNRSSHTDIHTHSVTVCSLAFNLL